MNTYNLFCKEILAPIYHVTNNVKDYDNKAPLVQIVIELHNKVLLHDNLDFTHFLPNFCDGLKELILEIYTKVVKNKRTTKIVILETLKRIFEKVKYELNYHNNLIRTDDFEVELIRKEDTTELFKNSVFFENLSDYL